MVARTTLLAIAAAFFSISNAAVLNLYSDEACQEFIASRNVFDNSCAPTGGFSSYIITTAGGSDQQITTYSANDCAETQTSCDSAGSLNICYPAFDSAGASNAIGSGIQCGIV